MKKTDNFRRQHDEILTIVSEISHKLNTQYLLQNSNEISGLLSKLAGKVKIHLAMEDQSLYPRLLNDKDAKVKSITENYMKEMGGISSVFVQYLEKWKAMNAIQSNTQTFISETKELFEVLEKRIKKENTELYPLVDNAA